MSDRRPNEAGKCPQCSKFHLKYGIMEPEGEQIFYPYTCSNCEFEGKEYYNLEFCTHMDFDGNEFGDDAFGKGA
jgi:hypothetical protein